MDRRRQTGRSLAGLSYDEQVRALSPQVQLKAESSPGGRSEGESVGSEGPWRGLGNLIGNPPVRSEHQPPNTAVVEDQATYDQRLAAANTGLETQQTRAAGMLDSAGNVTDYRFWFAKVYSYLTDNEILFAQSGNYYYPSYVLASVAYFEQIYADNCAALDAGQTVEDHWRIAFEECAREQEDLAYWRDLVVRAQGDPTRLAEGIVALGAVAPIVEGVVSSLVTSMKAHIRFDLPRAESWIFNTYYAGMEGVKIEDFRDDFMSMSGTFDNASASMRGEMADRLGLPIDLAPRIISDTVMSALYDADMTTERADTWQRTEDLVNEGGSNADPYALGAVGASDVAASDHASQLQELTNKDLRPSMASSASALDDDAARDQLSNLGDAQIARIPVTRKIRLVRAMLSGACTNDDERQIIRILQNAGRTLCTIVDGCNAWKLLDKMNGAEYAITRSILRARFYPRTSQQEALRLIKQCIDGRTAGWAQEMIADLFEDRGDRARLLELLGAHFGGPHYSDERNGLNQLQWQLGGVVQDRVEALFATP